MLFLFGRLVRFMARVGIFVAISWACYQQDGISWLWKGDYKDLFYQGQLLVGCFALLPVSYLLGYLGVKMILNSRGRGCWILNFSFGDYMFYWLSLCVFSLSLNSYWFKHWGNALGEKSLWPTFTSLSGIIIVSLLVLLFSGHRLKFWWEDNDDDDDD